MRLIDADVLIKKYGDWYVEDVTGEGFIGNMRAFVYDVVPTVDAVEVVRCKDCCHNEGSLSEPWCRIYECRKSNNGFCDEGERKEVEDE